MPRRHRPHFRVELLEDRTTPSFVAAKSFVVGPNKGVNSAPKGVVVGDFNRDGHLDVATADSGTTDVSILLGTGLGGFHTAANFNIGHNPVALVAADVNRDGKLDLITANKSDNSVTVLIGSGSGGFSVGGTFAAGSGPMAIAAGDFNHDGHTDLAVADNGSDTLTILTGNGTGHFTPGGTLTVGNSPTAVAVGDFNGDGKPDVASVSGGFGGLDVNLNTGTGSFFPATNYATGFCGNAVAVGDFNGDGAADVAIGCIFPSGDGVSILLNKNDGTGTFNGVVNYPAGNQTPGAIAVGDFNHDGHPDVVTANFSSTGSFANNSVSLLTNNGDGTFVPARVFVPGQAPEAIAVGDFNGDGLLDAVTADVGTVFTSGGQVGDVSLMLGNGDGTLLGAPDLVVDEPGPIVATDFTGDGVPDLAIVTGGVSYSGVDIFPGLGTGWFGTPIRTPSISQPNALAFGDFNGDGHADLAVTTTGGLSVMLNNGDGTFGTPTAFSDGNLPTWVAVSDLNGDGNPDVIVADGSGLEILPGLGGGNFGAFVPVSAGAANYVSVADLNHDGKPDLAVVNGSAGKVTVLLNQGNFAFTQPFPSYPTFAEPNSVSVGDFNKDGKPDLAVPTFFGNGASSALTIFQNAAGAKFTQKAVYDTDSRPVGSAAVDFTGDGKLDVATANDFSDDVYLFPGSGTGTFGKPLRYVVGDRPTWVAAGDFNGDGHADLAVVNSNAGSVTLLESPAPMNHFHVTANVATQTAGKAIVVTVTATDPAGKIIPGYLGSVSFTSTDPHALLPAAYTFTPTDQGTHRFTVVLKSAGARTVTVHGTGGIGTATVDVTPAAATHLKVSLPAGNPTAGTPFDLTVTALDPYGNTDPTYAGTVHLTTTDPNAGVTVPSDYPFTDTDAGTHTFSGGMTLLTAGLRTITAATVSGHVAGSVKATVVAGHLHGFLVSGFPTSIGHGVTHAFTVTAVDAYGNRVTNYLGTVQFGVTGGSGTLPANYTFKAFNKGKHTFRAALLTPGTGESLTVTDTSDNTITGAETGITVT